MADEKVSGRVIDGHSHIGELAAWKFYDLAEPVKPTGVSGHIRLVPRFLDWVEQGFKVYTDTTWSIGFAPRWLMTEIERRGVGHDRVLFSSDEPWSDFWSEYWKNAGAPVSTELMERILWQNFEEAYGDKG